MKKGVWAGLMELFGDEDPPGAVLYDPVHVAAVLVGCLAAAGALFWLLWALLVCEGGLFVKVGPALQVLFGGKTLADFGYEGHPHKLGIFEGWIVNLTALALCAAALAGLRWIFEGRTERKKR